MSIEFSRAGKDYYLKTEITLPYPIEEVFKFFSDSRNLQQLTPPWLDFTILDSQPDKMFVGKIIDYKIKIHGIPMRWRSEITTWETPRAFADGKIAAAFVDEQRKGPYQVWHHSHLFESLGEATVMRDVVRYRVFMGWFAHPIFVKPDLQRIFSYRLESLLQKFPPQG